MKMKWLVWMVAGICVPYGIHAGENLLYNGSFELSGGSPEKAAGWVGAYIREKVNGDGKYAVKCQCMGPGYSEANSGPYPAVPGREFRIFGKYKGAGAIVFAFFRLKDKKTKTQELVLKAAADWTGFTLKGKVPENAESCTVLLRCRDRKPVWFDAVRLESGALAELLRNGSFEKSGLDEQTAIFWRGLYVRKAGGPDGKFMVECVSPKSPYCESSSLPFAVRHGKSFTLNGMHKGAGAKVYAFFKMKNKKTVSRIISVPPSPSWKGFALRHTIPEDAVTCSVLLRNTNKKDATDFDAVSFISESPYDREVSAAGISIRLDGQIFPALQTAQRELAHYLPRVIRGGFKIDGVPLRRITVTRDSSLRDEEWKMVSRGDTLALSGGGTRGPLYAVYHFLEDILGIHWWNVREEQVPEARAWDIPAVSKQGKPHFALRDIYRQSYLYRDNGRFAVRNRLNRHGDSPITEEYGGSFTWGPPYHAHTFFRYINKGYLKTHPEFFSLVDGSRQGWHSYSGQLCLTNKKLRAYLVERMTAVIKKSRASALSAGVEPPRLYDLSMNDGNRFCECPECKNKENAGWNTSDILLDFINEIAKGVEKKYPDVLITTLAYGKTAVPPKTAIKPWRNVVIRFCNTFGPTVYPSERRNQEKQQWLRGWAAISPRIMCWNHSLEEYPFPYEMGLAELLRNYDKNHFMGVFFEMGKPYMVDCFDMRRWLCCKMLEDPYSDLETHRQIFLKGYYGKAAPMIDEYRKLLDRTQRRIADRWIFRHFAGSFAYMNVQELIQVHRLFDQAEKAVQGDSDRIRRVIAARAPLNLLTGFMIAHYNAEWKKSGGTTGNIPIDRVKLAQNMRKYWLKEAGFYPNPASIKAIMESQIAFVENLSPDVNPVPEPPEFKGRTVRHFTPSKLILFRNPNMRLVKDPDAREGCAFEVTGSRDYNLPVEVGFYDRIGCKTLSIKQWKELPPGEGYLWLHVGPVQLHRGCYVYVNRSRGIHAEMWQYLELGAKNLDVWCRIKFEGPDFKKKGSRSRMLVDSISLIELD